MDKSLKRKSREKMEEELKGKMDEKQTCEMEKEIDRKKGKVEDKPKHESNKGQTQQRKKKQFPMVGTVGTVGQWDSGTVG